MVDSVLEVQNIKLPDSGGVTSSTAITLDASGNTTATLSSSSNIKAPLNASGDAPVYACRAWVDFRGTSQSGTATASGLVSGQYTATVTSATQFTVEYSATTYTINTSGNHDIGNGEGVDLTVSGTTVTINTQIRASGNVSSITYNSTGNYTVNFANSMPDTNYSLGGFVRSNLATPNSTHTFTAGTGYTKSVNAVRIQTRYVNASAGLELDHPEICINVFR